MIQGARISWVQVYYAIHLTIRSSVYVWQYIWQAFYCYQRWRKPRPPALVAIVDGCPPGLPLSAEDLQYDLDRRKPGTSRHTTQRQEADQVEILSGGVFEGGANNGGAARLVY